MKYFVQLTTGLIFASTTEYVFHNGTCTVDNGYIQFISASKIIKQNVEQFTFFAKDIVAEWQAKEVNVVPKTYLY